MTSVLLERSGIVYQALDVGHLEATIDFVTQHFVKHEVLTRESGLTLESFGVFVSRYCEASIGHGLSIIALDQQTGELVGFSINEDPNSEKAVNAEQFYAIDPGYTLFLGMLSELSERFFSLESKPNYSFHLYLLGVRPSHQGRKIGTILVELSEIIAKEHGFSYLVIEAISPGTLPICLNLGYTHLGQNAYQSFVLEGKKPFAHITDYDGPHLFMKSVAGEKLE